MRYNKEELLGLPADEKIALAEELWNSVENEDLPITEEELNSAGERLKLHEANPDDGTSGEEFKMHFSAKYGF